MKKKLYLILFGFFGYSVTSNAQYFTDALRFSQSNYNLGSTARIQAIGGAQVALGGDISSALSNPAGLGFFNKSVFVVTPSLDFINANTEYGIFGSDGLNPQGSEETFKNNFNFANIGTVINFGKGRFTDDKFKGGSLAITLNRNNTYHLNRTYEGENNFNALADVLAGDAGLTDPSFFESLENIEFYDQAAYLSYLISPNYNNDNLTGYFADFDGYPIQREVIEQRGSHYETNIAWGGNYDDRLYFGGGIGGQFLNYKEQRTFEEFDFGEFDSNDNFIADPRLNSVFVYDERTTRGFGVDFNFGLIYRPVEFLTLGASYTSPAFLTLEEESFFDFEANWKPGAEYVEGSDVIDLNSEVSLLQSSIFVNKYRLRTPSRVSVGAAAFIGKNGFLTGDLEFVDYSRANLNSDDFSTASDNDVINDTFNSVVNVRVGGEYRFDNFRLRAGYAIFPDPVKDSTLDDRTSITFGFGYRTFDYYLDFAAVSSSSQQQAVPYFIGDNQPVATSDIRNTTVSVTFGLNF